MLSYWEKESLITFDVIIIGSGIVGLNAAIAYKSRYPNLRVVIFERGILPTGASTRNAGFACFGGLSELVDDLQYDSEDALVNLYAKRKNGITLLRSLLGDTAIGFEQNGSHEFLRPDEANVLDHLDNMNVLLKEHSKMPIFTRDDSKIKHFGISEKHYQYCIAAHEEGSIHTGKMMQSLLELALKKGIVIKTGVMVDRFEENNGKVTVEVKDDIRNGIIQFQCAKLLICTNAFTSTFFPNLDIVPGRGQVIVTKPIPNLQLQGIFHLDKGYYYFREINNRVLLGGGRNLDFKGETSTEFEGNATILAALIQKLQEEILPNHPFEIDMQWSGIMAFAASKQPIIHRHSDAISGAFRLGGMGVALGAQLALDLVELAEA